MPDYILRRLLLMVPTLLGVLLLNFIVVQFVPGGPVDQMIAQLRGNSVSGAARIGVGADSGAMPSRAEQGLDPAQLAEIKALYGFDKPAPERFFQMIGQYLRFDFGDSFFRAASVTELILQKMPVSISLGLWTVLLVYLISIPLGIAKAVRDGSAFDLWTSTVIVIGYAVPSFLFGLLLIVLFAGGSYVSWFPLRGLVSDHWHTLPWGARILDYFWHLALPVTAMVINGFASLTMLTKNAFLDEVGKQYALTARAKGLNERQVLWGHVFRNAMLLIIASFPAALLGIFFTGSMLIEVIFSLDGLGLLGFEAALQRDYPVVLGTLYIFTLFGLFIGLISDLTYRLVDPRIDFERRA